MRQAFHPTSLLPEGPRANSWSPKPSPRRPQKRPAVPASSPPKDMLSNAFDSPLARQRRRWFTSEMGKNRSLFTSEKPLRLFAGTWNVNGRPPDPNADFAKWLFPAEHASDPFDIYMLGFQEIQNLTYVDAVRSDARRAQEWRDKMQQVLGTDYDLIADRQLVGIIVMVFLRKNHVPFLSNVKRSYAGTGFLNAMGNKGGVAARFQLYDRTISCVACHLAAHTEFVDRRNQDFRDVVRKAVFLPDDDPEQAHSSSALPNVRDADVDDVFDSKGALHRADSANNFGAGATNGPTGWLNSFAAAISDISAGANTAVLNDPNALKILDHDVVFWLGDLNYRLDAEHPEVMSWIEQRNWQKLYQADQLQQQMKTCDVFQGFKEGPIRFPPTYKMNRMEEGYKTGENGEPVRVPAYTDRILWRLGENIKGREAAPKPQVELLRYNSAPVLSSDHRPVYASFRMMFGVEDMNRRASVEQMVNRELDKREESFRPSLQFSTSVVEFGDVFYEQRCTRKVTIRNTGPLTTFVTLSLPSDSPKWLLFDPSAWRNVEVPAGKAVQLQFGVFITGKDGSANTISRNGCVLNAAVKLAGEPGGLREVISIRGRYVASTLGLSLETLSMLERPVLALRDPSNSARSLFASNYKEEHDREQEPGAVPHPVPKELWLLIQGLLRPGSDEQRPLAESNPSVFLREGEEVDIQRALSFVDRGEQIPRDVDGDAIGSCLLQVLANLEDSVVPQKLSKRVLEAGSTEDTESVHNVLDMLPPLNANVFWYVVGFLRTCVLIEQPVDVEKRVAELFADVLLPRTDSRSGRQQRTKTGFMLEAMRIHQAYREPKYRGMFDLTWPDAHPKKHKIESSFSG
eukprot:GFKZ01002147.1.p1 GENE.GFKZ01002147.1~~GFKZ01002147.1.p1  ORF type:complete len:857 (+),score=86.81 GFKZ01002147.1:17-2587(+)